MATTPPRTLHAFVDPASQLGVRYAELEARFANADFTSASINDVIFLTRFVDPQMRQADPWVTTLFQAYGERMRTQSST